ncbi:MAG: PAS domain-containing sensor histidine kinase [Desulfobacterales bacterium]|nr:PAS domain-containing sensor histidine kinase [Desulfobacterales bacterium]
MIYELCRQHTDLESADIKKLEDLAMGLGVIADLNGADIFIDCCTRDADVAVVVAQAQPTNVPSLYKGSVVGQFAYRSKEPAVLRTMELGLPTTDLRAVTQENKNVRQDVSPIKNKEGRVIGTLIAEKDVTASLKAEKDLSVLARTTENLMDALMSPQRSASCIPQHVTDGIVMFDAQGACTYANPVAEALYRKLGYMGNLVGIRFSSMTLDGIRLADVMEKQQLSPHEVKVGEFVLHLKYAVLKNKDLELMGIVMLISDVTDVRKKEEELILKSVAISEIHHRVKNNLQTIASLLRLQSRRIEDDSARTAFSKSITRVLSIAATHEILALEGVDDVDIKTMLKRIHESITTSGLISNRGVRISIEGDSFMIGSEAATSIALVVNEVVQNSLNYAFVGRDRGRITIQICKGTMYSNIAITDDGIGYDTEKVRQGNLGTKIVKRIVEGTLKGKLSTRTGPEGTTVCFDFPHNRKEE